MIRGFNRESRVEIAGSGYLPFESVDNHIICLMRGLLAASALIITLIDPTSPDRFVELTYTVLSGYLLYSAILYFLPFRTAFLASNDLTPWIDVAWYLALIALSDGTSSIFFFFFFFSILIAAFRSGFNEGLRVTVVSTLLFSIIGYATAPHGQNFELNRFLIRPVYLTMIGYMISYWGGQEIKFKHHLMLLKDINHLSNPRFGVNRTLSDIINRVRTFYGAESCLLITFDPSTEIYSWRESSREKPYDESEIEQTKAAAPLINLPGNLAIFYQNNTDLRYFGSNGYAYDVSTGGAVEIPTDICTAITDLLDTKSFLTVPVMQREEIVGRLYLTALQNFFERSELEFVSHLTDQVLRAVENVELLNRLASGAAERQRQKISRDLHDSTIQPYIGLKLGLEALEIKQAAGAAIENDIEKLIKLTNTTIADLRGYISTLKSEDVEVEGNVLILAVRQQAIKFKEFYDVSITVQVADDFQINDRLAAEAFQIVSEGLSNIKRHTKAKYGTICIYRDAENLFLIMENDDSDAVLDFVPKSIAGRAKSLGGRAWVEILSNTTKVFVEIPL